MTRALSFLVALVGALSAAAPAEAMRCDNRLVTTGDSSAEVMARCGEPEEVVQRTETRTRVVQRRLPDGSVVQDAISVSVVVERWTYDFGPRRFMRLLLFEDGVLVRIDTAGYGTPGHEPR